MSDGLISLLFALGSSGYVYANIARRAGTGNGNISVISAAIIFVIAFIFLFTLMKYVLHV